MFGTVPPMGGIKGSAIQAGRPMAKKGRTGAGTPGCRPMP